MKELVFEIRTAFGSGFYYVALAIALSLPDICAALEAPDGKTTKTQYLNWHNKWLAASYPMMTAQDVYSLRCGVIHEGRFGHEKMQYSRVVFTLPHSQNNIFHGSVMDDALNLNASIFCEDILRAVERWSDAKQTDPCVQANLPRLFKYRPNGLLPFFHGVPVIA